MADNLDTTEAEDADLAVELDDDRATVTDTEDGGAIVEMEETARPGESEHYANLAEGMNDAELLALGGKLGELIEQDKRAREPRDKKYSEGLKRTGVTDDAPGGAQFMGASRVVHPMLLEACVDFASRAVKELMPPTGPVKDKVIGRMTRAKAEKARRKTDYMNWQLTVQVSDFRNVLEQLLVQLPMGGSQYLKGPTRDRRTGKPRFRFVPIDNVYLPFSATSYYSAERRTEVIQLTEADALRMMENGEWRKTSISSSAMIPEESQAQQQRDKAEGKEDSGDNPDDVQDYWECDCWLDLEDLGERPYTVTMEAQGHNVLAIYRCWEESDDSDKPQRIDRMQEAPFVPWSGAYGIGFPNMIGGLSATATGALRALLDAAFMANSQTALALKGKSATGQTLNPQPGTISEIEGGAVSVDPDIRKIIMPFPYPGPNAVLFQLLGFVVDAAKGVIRTTLENVAEEGTNVPVGTTLARMSEGMVVFSAIHARLNAFMDRVLASLHRYNAIWLDNEETVEELGELVVKRSDFEGPRDVIPVSDPNIFSDAQRTAQIQAVAQRAAAMPAIYDAWKVEERVLEQLRVPAYKELLVPRPEPKELNAVNENIAAMAGRPVIAFPTQDHLAHIQAHLEFLESPMFGGDPLVAPRIVPGIAQHIEEHKAFWYANRVYESANAASLAAGGPDDIADVALSKDPEEKAALDRLLATTSGAVLAEAQETFAKIPPIIAKAMQMIQSMQPPPPMDPTMVGMAEVERQKTRDQMEHQVKTQDLQLRAQDMQQRAGLAEAKVQEAQQRAEGEAAKRALAEQQLQANMAETNAKLATQAEEFEIERSKILADLQTAQADNAARIAMNTQDNETALIIAGMKGASASLDPNPENNPDPEVTP